MALLCAVGSTAYLLSSPALAQSAQSLRSSGFTENGDDAGQEVVGLPDEPVVEHSSATSDTVRDPDGTVTLHAYTTPINFSNRRDEWQPIDNQLVPSAGDVYAVENAANDYTVKIPEDSAEDPIRVSVDDGWVSMRMHYRYGITRQTYKDAKYRDDRQRKGERICNRYWESQPKTGGDRLEYIVPEDVHYEVGHPNADARLCEVRTLGFVVGYLAARAYEAGFITNYSLRYGELPPGNPNGT